MENSALEKNLESLFKSKEYRSLQQIKITHNVFTAFQAAIDEYAYSRFLTYLLDSDTGHGLKTRFITKLIRSSGLCKCDIPTNGVTSQSIFNWPTSNGRYIDILVILRNPADNTFVGAIGIENKTKSKESLRQLQDYQDCMSRFFKGVPHALLFLTPTGCAPETAHKVEHDCTVIPISYKLISKICRSNWSNITPDFAVLLTSFGDFIDTDLTEGTVMNEVKKNISKLVKLPKHRHAIELICRYSPVNKPTIRNLAYEQVPGRLNELGVRDVHIEWHFPNYSLRPREINFSVGDINDKLFRRSGRIYYMLYAGLTDDPDIGDEFTAHCMLWDTKYDSSKGKSTACKNFHNKLIKSAKLPVSLGKNRQWGPWHCLYTGHNYRLKDLGEGDAIALANILSDCITSTYTKINRAIQSI